MTRADEYRVKAGDLAALAKAETDRFQKAEYQRLSAFYLRLADQADRNSHTDVVWIDPLYETPAQPQAQQQQQPQPDKKED